MNILGIDIGGSAIKAALVNPVNGTLVADKIRIPTPQPATPVAIAETIVKIIEHFDWTGSVGCGLPAVIHNDIACTAANIDTSWIGIDVVELLFVGIEDDGIVVSVIYLFSVFMRASRSFVPFLFFCRICNYHVV